MPHFPTDAERLRQSLPYPGEPWNAVPEAPRTTAISFPIAFTLFVLVLLRGRFGAQPGTPASRRLRRIRLAASWLACGVFVIAWRVDEISAGVLGVLAIPLLFPWFLARGVCIPLGWPAAAALLASWSSFVWGEDLDEAEEVAGAWAAARRRVSVEPAPATAGASIGVAFARALRTSSTDVPLAREIVKSLENDAFPRPSLRARALASEWLAVEAIERGAWDEVAAVELRAGPKTRTTRLLLALARRLISSESRPSGRAVLFLWLLAPHRAETWPLVFQVLASPPPEPPVRRQETPRPPTAMTAAIARQRGLLEHRDADWAPRDIEDLADAWEDALDPDERPPLDAAGLYVVRANVVDDLAWFLRRATFPFVRLHEDGPLLREARDRALQDIRAEIAHSCQVLAERRFGPRVPVDLERAHFESFLRDWNRAFSRLEHAERGDHFRRYEPGFSAYVKWLTAGDELALAREVATWLLAESMQVAA